MRHGAVLIVSALALLAAPAIGQPEGEVYTFEHSFRGRPLPAELTPYQVDDDSLLRFEPEGLRITFPKKYKHPAGGVGVQTSTVLRGDFDVTATVEIIELERPPTGSGAGVGLSVNASERGEQLRRVVGANGRNNILRTSYASAPNKKNLIWTEGNRTPCEEMVIRLRLKRTGPILHYLWAPGANGDSFNEIHDEIFADDVDHIRLFAANAIQGSFVDVRLLDLRIHCAQKAGPAVSTAKTGTRRWMMWFVLFGVGVVLTAGGGLYMRRRAR
jgi:hypothetical protein